MKLTPLDIRQKRFATALRGFDRREVEPFLELLASEFEEVVKENIALKEENKRLASRLETHQERERTLQETMVTAQRISEDVKHGARKEAEIIVSGAELQAEQIVQGAHARLVKVIEDINELKRQRAQFESQVQSVIDAHQKLLETFRAVPGEPLPEDDNVAYLSRPQRRAQSGE